MIVKLTTPDQLRHVMRVVYDRECEGINPPLWTYGDLAGYLFKDRVPEDMRDAFMASAERQSQLATAHMMCGIPGDDLTELEEAGEELDRLMEHVQLPVYVAVGPGMETPHVEFAWEGDLEFKPEPFESGFELVMLDMDGVEELEESSE